LTAGLPGDDERLRTLLRLSLDEDLADRGDLTTAATVSPDLVATAVVVARESFVVAGLALFDPLTVALAERCGRPASPAPLALTRSVGDGARVATGDEVCALAGTARDLLVIERTFLNFLERLSGIATLTSRYVDAVAAVGADTRVLDTRKTTPGHRLLEKYAVRCGGGSNHRMGLYDAILIKDNHVVAAGGIDEAVKRALAGAPDGVAVEVECDTLEQVERALELGARAVLVDNFTPEQVAVAVTRVAGRARVEVSGGVDLDTIAAYAAAGPDDISVGRLTHGARWVDVSMSIDLS